MRYFGAAIACVAIFLGYSLFSQALGWNHLGGAIPLLFLVAILTFVWRTMTRQPAATNQPTDSELPHQATSRHSAPESVKPVIQSNSLPTVGSIERYESTVEIGSSQDFVQSMLRPEEDSENAVYERIDQEFKTDSLDRGLWTRLFAECDGDENATKVQYIKQRAAKLMRVERERIAFEEAERNAKVRAEDARRVKLLQSSERLVLGVANGEVNALPDKLLFLSACRRGEIETVSQFIEKDTLYLGVTDSDGMTGLHWAICERNSAMIDLLLREGASVFAKMRSGKSALEYAHDRLAPVDRALLSLDEAAIAQQKSLNDFLGQYGISFDGRKFYFQTYSYDNLGDAVAYVEQARKQGFYWRTQMSNEQ